MMQRKFTFCLTFPDASYTKFITGVIELLLWLETVDQANLIKKIQKERSQSRSGTCIRESLFIELTPTVSLGVQIKSFTYGYGATSHLIYRRYYIIRYKQQERYFDVFDKFITSYLIRDTLKHL